MSILIFIITIVLTLGLLVNTVSAGKNYNSSKSNTFTVGQINEDIGNILIRDGIGGAEINQVTDALEQGISEEELRLLLDYISVSEAGEEEVLVELDRLGASVQAQTGGTIQIPAKGKSIAPAGTEEGTTPAPAKDYNTTRSNPEGVAPRLYGAGTDVRAAPSGEDVETPARTKEDIAIVKDTGSPNERIAGKDGNYYFPLAQPVRSSAVEVRGWDKEKKAEFLQTVKTHAEIKSQQDLDNFAKGVLLRDENIKDIEITEKRVKVDYRIPAKFLGIFPASLSAKVRADADSSVKVRYPWFGFFFSKSASAEAIQSSTQEAVKGKTQASQMLEALRVALVGFGSFSVSK